MSKKNRGSLFLIIAAFIWGTTFAAQKLGLESMPPMAFNGSRMLLGSVVCFCMYMIGQFFSGLTTNKESVIERKNKDFSPALLKGGLACGLLLFVASNFQQVGLVYTTPGKAGFITTLYIIMVPVLGIFVKRIPKPIIWFCALLAVVGFFLMCVTDDFSLGKGDLLVLVCALAFAIHIIVVDKVAPYVNGILLSSGQFLICGLLSIITSLFVETTPFTLQGFAGALPAILYAGFLSCGIAYTFQIFGQRDVPPALASLLMSFESVFSIVGEVVVFRKFPSLREAAGCLLVFIAVILAQKTEGEGEKS